ncbi:probable 3',5'-cyclic phosphodiesterase pde-5 isoform X1 [Lepeophtheirus salmonis]
MNEDKQRSDAVNGDPSLTITPIPISKIKIVVGSSSSAKTCDNQKTEEKFCKILPPLQGRYVTNDFQRRPRSRSPRVYQSENGPNMHKKGAHNRFHHNCCERKPQLLDDIRTKSQLNALKRRKSHFPSFRSTGDLTGYNGAHDKRHPLNTETEIVTNFLNTKPSFLIDYALKHLDLPMLEKICSLKKNQLMINSLEEPSSQLLEGNLILDKRIMLKSLTSSIAKHKENNGLIMELKFCILREIGRNICKAINARRFKMYLAHPDKKDELLEFDPMSSTDEQSVKCHNIFNGVFDAFFDEYLDNTTSKMFNGNSDISYGKIRGTKEDDSVLIHSILCSDYKNIEGFLEFKKPKIDGSFSDMDEALVDSYLVWGELSIHYSDMCFNLERQNDLSHFLLSIVKSLFNEVQSMDTIITKIMHFAHKLVNADRASMFLVDNKTNQLYARIFDITNSSNEMKPGSDNENNNNLMKEIRFPIGTGIAGYVAKTGKVLNVSNVDEDPRFNRNVDEQTGYTTKSILCMPISIYGSIIGIVQIINKKDGFFTKDDEKSFDIFSTYCGLALHHAKLYEKIRRSEHKCKVTMEVLSYHNSATSKEVAPYIQAGPPIDDISVQRFSFYALDKRDEYKIEKALFMFVDLFGLDRFDYNTLVFFFVTIKKNYRDVPYHNWSHGFHVANSVYSIIKSDPGLFRPLECLSMFVGGLCHDLDHRGYNNKFMIDIGSPLASIYTTSTMEYHHFNMTINILQNDKQNILKKFNQEEYRQIMGNMKHCILATDLALFFPNKARLTSIIKYETFSWQIPDHRLLVQSILIAGCDLCNSYKPWDLQLSTVYTVYEEFFKQGDVEKTMGWTPIPLFDRSHASEIASMQVGFIGGICLPCYELMSQVIPTTSPMMVQCKRNLEDWKKKAVSIKLQESDEASNKNEDENECDEESEELLEEENEIL